MTPLPWSRPRGAAAPADARAQHLRALLADGHADGERGTIAFLTGPAGTDREQAAPDVAAAAALALRLAAHRFGVLLLPPERWAEVPATAAAAVLVTPAADPAVVPGTVPAIAWAIDRPNSWLAHSGLALFDAVLAGSDLLRDRLSRVLRRQSPHAMVAVLPLAADVDAAAPPARSRTVRVVPIGDEANRVAGVVPARVYDAIVAGELPVVDSRLGLAAIGPLAALPVYRSARERDRLVAELTADPATPRKVAELGVLVRREHTWSARARTFAEWLPRLAAPRPEPRPVLGFFPDFRVTNPYQDMLYAALPARGVRVAPVRRLTEQLALRDGGGDLAGHVLHVHWTNAVAQVTEDPAEARQRLDAFRNLLLDLRARGGRVAWTVHNVLPHELRHPELELELCRFLAAQADLVHVMSEETLALTAPHYALDPARTEVIPHSSYDGIYPDVVSRAAARRRLGLLEHDVALLALGGIRAYRGLDTLLDAFDALLERDVRVRLLVVGKPGPAAEVAQWRERCEAHPRILARFEHVPEADLQLWNRAADVAVLPYRAILNSGAFKLAETFGLPIVAPREGSLAAALDPAYTRGFDPDSPGDLLRALEEAVELVTDPAAAERAHAAARSAAAGYPPQRMGDDFAAVLEKRLLGALPVTGQES